jgi:hypothetical protein
MRNRHRLDALVLQREMMVRLLLSMGVAAYPERSLVHHV